MHLIELMGRMDRAGLTLTYFSDEDRLNAKPTAALTPDLIEDIGLHKEEIVQFMRDEEGMRRTGVIQSERQVFDLAHEYFGMGGGAG